MPDDSERIAELDERVRQLENEVRLLAAGPALAVETVLCELREQNKIDDTLVDKTRDALRRGIAEYFNSSPNISSSAKHAIRWRRESIDEFISDARDSGRERKAVLSARTQRP